jgi:hypothetical protein
MNIYQNTEFFKFLDLCGVIINNDTNLPGLIQDFNEFDNYRSTHIENSFEHNFIKWQQISRVNQKECESVNQKQCESNMSQQQQNSSNRLYNDAY